MNKKLLALAIGTAVAMPVAALADGPSETCLATSRNFACPGVRRPNLADFGFPS